MANRVARSLAERQLVLVTGKGGVGKTTLAAAYARAARRAGEKVLLAEVTSDVGTRSQLLGFFGHSEPKGEVPVSMGRDLWGVRITPSSGHRMFLRDALRVGVLADAAMRSNALNRFLTAAPAFPEIGTLYQLVSYIRSGSFDRLVLDLPATGHALGLAKLPRTVARVVPRGLIKDAITDGLTALTNPRRTGVLIATLPERLPVSEAFELAKGLEAIEVPVGAMVLNRVPANPFTDEERAALDAHIRKRRRELLLGARELRRIERALDAQTVFRERATEAVPAMELPLVSGEWSRVIEEAADRLVEAGLAREGAA